MAHMLYRVLSVFTLVLYLFGDVQGRESLEEAALNARKLVSSTSLGIGTLISTFPNNASDGFLAGRPTGLLEYFAATSDGSEHPGSVYVLLMPISPNVQNILSAPAHQATLSIKDEQSEIDKGPKWATNRARLVLWGNVSIIDTHSKEAVAAATAFARTHPDAVFYFPPHGPHRAFWARFDPEKVYYLGGFGNLHYIGEIPLEMYKEGGERGLRIQT